MSAEVSVGYARFERAAVGPPALVARAAALMPARAGAVVAVAANETMARPAAPSVPDGRPMRMARAAMTIDVTGEATFGRLHEDRERSS